MEMKNDVMRTPRDSNGEVVSLPTPARLAMTRGLTDTRIAESMASSNQLLAHIAKNHRGVQWKYKGWSDC